MFKIGDKVIINDVEHAALTVVKTECNNVLLENCNSERFWMPCECLHKAPKREVEIFIKVEISDDAKYVAVDKCGSVCEYIFDCCEDEDRGFFLGNEMRELEIKNWKQTKTKVGD